MKTLRFATKIGPVIIVFLMVVELIFALIRVNISNYTYHIIGHSLFYNGYFLIASYAFSFCKWHRLLIYNLIILNIVGWIYENVVRFNPLYYVWGLLLIMLTLSTASMILYLKYGCFNVSRK